MIRIFYRGRNHLKAFVMSIIIDRDNRNTDIIDIDDANSFIRVRLTPPL